MIPALDQTSGTKVLVIDDNPNELTSLVIGLKLEGFQTAGVPDGTRALEMLGDDEYMVALIDLMMPEINGLQLARRIRDSHPEVVTILMSAYHLSPVQLAKANVGVVGFVPKPFRFGDLVNFIKGKLGQPVSTTETTSVGKRPTAEMRAPFDVPPLTAGSEPPTAAAGAPRKAQSA